MCDGYGIELNTSFLGRNFVKFWLEKYDCDLIKGFFMEKSGTNSPDFKNKYKLPDFYDKVPVSK